MTGTSLPGWAQVLPLLFHTKKKKKAAHQGKTTQKAGPKLSADRKRSQQSDINIIKMELTNRLSK
jgi:hypothetical protein